MLLPLYIYLCYVRTCALVCGVSRCLYLCHAQVMKALSPRVCMQLQVALCVSVCLYVCVCVHAVCR